MRTITIKVKYDVGDEVWIMKNNYPLKTKVFRVTINGGSMDAENGQTSNLGLVLYILESDRYKEYVEQELCDTFEQLRSRVFSKDLKNQGE